VQKCVKKSRTQLKTGSQCKQLPNDVPFLVLVVDKQFVAMTLDSRISESPIQKIWLWSDCNAPTLCFQWKSFSFPRQAAHRAIEKRTNPEWRRRARLDYFASLVGVRLYLGLYLSSTMWLCDFCFFLWWSRQIKRFLRSAARFIAIFFCGFLSFAC